jgi:hypothetical protein
MVMEKMDDEERSVGLGVGGRNIFGLYVTTEDVYALNSSEIRSITRFCNR